MKTTVILLFFVYFCQINVKALSFPGPRVYVVTPASRHLQKDESKPAPFYYHKWMDGWRRMDTSTNDTTSTTSTTSATLVKTPDLIFAEFESDGSMQKSIRKLLEKEKAEQVSTMSPIYVPDDEDNKVTRVVNYGLPVKLNNDDINKKASTEKPFSFMFNNDYYNNEPAPIFVHPTTEFSTTTATPSTTSQSPVNVENIWHIIDNEKLNKYSGNWHEESAEENEKSEKSTSEISFEPDHNRDPNVDINNIHKDSSEEVQIDENFALPGFVTNPGNGAENESRAIRTEPNIRFPYVNLKPFQIKPSKKPLHNTFSKGTKNNNLLTNLDQFTDLKQPVRGEAQDIVPSPFIIDRYNPAQPYLPQPSYGTKVSKQSSPTLNPQKATASLVPPPPPPPKVTDSDFPSPVSYDSFPPYPPSESGFGGPPVPSISTKIKVPDTNSVTDITDSNDNDDGPPMDSGYRYKHPSISEDDTSPMLNMGYQYKPPSQPVPQFIPTIPPAPKPFGGYTYNKPSMPTDIVSMSADQPEIQGYQYGKPEHPKPQIHMPHSYESPPSYAHEDTHSYGPDSAPTYSHDDTPSYGHHSDYPELIFKKPHDDMKGDDMKDSMGMMPPLPPTDTKDMAYGPPMDDHGPPMDDHGFPADFPTDFKFHHDFEDHDHDHYHHHTTTTTTETPRVNRFSYYYLGKKLYYLPLYFSVYFIIYVGALIIKAVLRHKIVYPNSWRPNTTTASFFSKRSVDEFMSHENLHEVTRQVTHAIATAAEKYMKNKKS